ncbi:Palmitoyltransferase [Paragonimus heterotremus]|uniref:Palmitoyltransferase n=1 Tax=Paragonimus heterotremus TaxID=100268 RepID=A0A8J4T0H9_9TREM|nr:Palmitoyltransferase [Paragonimus heterotremus]
MYLVLTQPGVHTEASTNATIWETFARETSKRCAQLLLKRPLSELLEADSFGYNLLHRACLKRDATVVAALLQSGVDPNSKTTCGVTAVHLAASVGQTTILHMLFQYGATLDQKENRGRTALHYAAENDHVISFAWLLQYPQAGSLNSADQDGVTPLHLACCAVKSQVLHYLLRNGQTESKRLTWSPSVIDRFGNTCLHAPLVCIATTSSSNSQSLEAERRVMDVIWSMLTAPSSSPTEPPPIVLCHSRNREGLTPLDLAKRHSLLIALIWLLTLSQLFTSKFRECTARTLLILTYSVVWILVLFFPLTASIVIFSLSDYFEQGWICFVLAGAFLWFSLKQRHRMDDGTNRPNPFFAGALIAGFFTTLFCYMWDLFPWDHSLSDGYRQACVWFLLTVPPLMFLLFINLIFSDPDVALPIDHLNAFSDPALLDYIERESSLVWASLSSDTEPVTPHTSSRTQSFNSYCPFCKVALMSALQIKHCKMCNRLRMIHVKFSVFSMTVTYVVSARLNPAYSGQSTGTRVPSHVGHPQGIERPLRGAVLSEACNLVINVLTVIK